MESKPRPSSCLMEKRRIRVELLWEARVVVVWMVPEQPRMLVCPLPISCPLITPFCVRMLSVKRRGDEWKTRAQKLTTSQKSSLWVDLCRLLVANQRESHLRKQWGEHVSFQRQRLHWMRLDYRFVSFQTSQ